MAVGIMSACCRASVRPLYFLVCFLQVLIQGEVFRAAPRAHEVLIRPRRANMFLLEELLQGNLERECFEELCNFEEAREYFENSEKTISFWTIYYDGDQCDPNPCLQGGNCTDKVGGFQCLCPAPHFGTICELGLDGRLPPSAPQVNAPVACLSAGPTACQQLCTASYLRFTCSCTSGFKLQTDGHSCLPEVEFPCGRLPDTLNATTSMCRHGNCPWQVSLLNRRGAELCGGVVLGRRSILTSARCLVLESGSDLRPSSFYVLTGNRKLVPVQALYVHDRFHLDHHDNDLALLELADALPFGPALIHLCLPTKDFSENILMHSGRAGVAGRWGGRRNQNPVYATLDECRGELNVTRPLSNKMFCMRRNDGAARNQNGVQGRSGGHVNGSGALNHKSSSVRKEHVALRSEVAGRRCSSMLSGSPVATVEHGTAFLTGLLISPSTGCNGGLVFTKLSRHLTWIMPRLEEAEDRMTPQVSEYPETR
ncbi:putative coagulation factor X-like [Scophthalmus maximus]|nr:putative coagulation factor X-like [Scophthalmus maximus]